MGSRVIRSFGGIDLQEVLEGIKAAKKAGHEILMNCVINSKNMDELEDLVISPKP